MSPISGPIASPTTGLVPLSASPSPIHLSQHHRTRRATPAAPASATHQASLTPRRPLPSTLHVYVSLPPRTADRASGNPRTLHSPSIEGTRVTTPVTTLLRPPGLFNFHRRLPLGTLAHRYIGTPARHGTVRRIAPPPARSRADRVSERREDAPPSQLNVIGPIGDPVPRPSPACRGLGQLGRLDGTDI